MLLNLIYLDELVSKNRFHKAASMMRDNFWSCHRILTNRMSWFALVLILLLPYLYILSQQDKLAIMARPTSKTSYHVGQNLFMFNTKTIVLHRSNALNEIYEQQYFHYRASSFLPSYQNHRVKLRISVSSLAQYLYGDIDSFQGKVRHLKITCLKRHIKKTTFESYFNFTLLFAVQKLNRQRIYFALISIIKSDSSLIITAIPSDKRKELTTQINVCVNQMFSVDTVFSFKYQWLDLDIVNFFYWPKWPLNRPCAYLILKSLIKNQTSDSKYHFACSITNTLSHSTSQQLFRNERLAISDWLDAQHKSTIANSLPVQDQLNNLLSSTARTRRLSPFESISDPKICSPEFKRWISKYQDWHENVSSSISDPQLTFEQQRDRIINQNIRFMFYEKHPSGMTDRIAHLVSTYLIAILTNRLFVFHADWPEFSEVMLSSINYEREFVTPWFYHLNRLNKNIPQNSTKYLTLGKYKFSLDRLRRDYDYDKEFPERILIFRGHTGAIVHMMRSGGSIYRKFLTEFLRMNANKMFGCLYHSLIIYRLSALIERTSKITSYNPEEQEQLGHTAQQLLQVLLLKKFYPIGIQVRTGDPRMALDRFTNWFKFVTYEDLIFQSFRYFLTCAQEIVNNSQTFVTDSRQVPIVFLISDNARFRRATLLRRKLLSSCIQSFTNTCNIPAHALPVIADSNPVIHTAYTSQRSLALNLAMFDIFLFGFCEQHVITAESGFGNLGAFAALKQRDIYSLYTVKQQSCLGENHHIPLVVSSYRWSGIR